MKIHPSLVIVPALLFTTACSTHYSVAGHSHRHHRSHVSVGVHGHGHGSEVLGALIIGGIIGHALSEANNEAEEEMVRSESRTTVDQMENGYTIDKTEKTGAIKPEKNSEQNRFYQLGRDGKCYLMEKKGESVEIVSAVPKFSCQ